MPKARKVIVCREGIQVYPADIGEDIWHIFDKNGPIAEIQFITGPTDLDEEPELVIQDQPDYLIMGVPEAYQTWEDRR
jgi:hypothetical protein